MVARIADLQPSFGTLSSARLAECASLLNASGRRSGERTTSTAKCQCHESREAFVSKCVVGPLQPYYRNT